MLQTSNLYNKIYSIFIKKEITWNKECLKYPVIIFDDRNDNYVTITNLVSYKYMLILKDKLSMVIIFILLHLLMM